MVKIFVGNLPSDCGRSDILDLFEKYGKVRDCDIIRNFAFVHFDDEEEARDAVDSLHKSKFLGELVLSVSVSEWVHYVPKCMLHVYTFYRYPEPN